MTTEIAAEVTSWSLKVCEDANLSCGYQKHILAWISGDT
jgi:hypothetical protein